MKTTLLSSIVLVICALGALGSPIEEVRNVVELEERAAQTNFILSCPDTSFNTANVGFTATCRNNAGGQTTSTISLDKCLGNSNGQLVIQQGGSFSRSCSGRTFLRVGNSVTLIAQCTNNAGNSVSSNIDLNAVLSNANGILTCP